MDPPKTWIRGVNLGGWLVVERYIVPYFFAVTDCHLHGYLCWYPGQLSANVSAPDHELCNLYTCSPHLAPNAASEEPDYPMDEYSLGEAFLSAQMGRDAPFRNEKGLEIAERWFNSHFDNFISQDDVQQIAASGVTHVRVPLPHWIMADVRPDEPWIVGSRWQAFLRLCEWARKYKLQVWPDIHTAPGSQNGFDNSGQALGGVSCRGWSNNPDHVMRSLKVVHDVSVGVLEAGYQDVVTGFGLLNEPFKDCDRHVYKQFLLDGKDIVQSVLGPDTAIYVGDMFSAKAFNDGEWWLDPEEYRHTYLDSHYYHVFAAIPRELSPRQHIAFTCQRQWHDATSCCYQDAKRSWSNLWMAKNSVPSTGVQRIIGEWSAAWDTLPVAKLLDMMKSIAKDGVVIEFDREFTEAEKDFMKHFVEAQMVIYEAADTGTSAGWFYWTTKMEGGAFGEWDYLRGVREGWIPVVDDSQVPSVDVFGTCYDIIFKTADDSASVVHTFPDPSTLPANNWQGVLIDDDVVVTHGQSLMKADHIHHQQRKEHDRFVGMVLLTMTAILVVLILLVRRLLWRLRKPGYSEIPSRIEF